MSWNMPGSSPGSPVSGSFNQSRLSNSNSLPSSPQTRSESDNFDTQFNSFAQNNQNIQQANHNLAQPEQNQFSQAPNSPVPNIVFTPSNENGKSRNVYKPIKALHRVLQVSKGFYRFSGAYRFLWVHRGSHRFLWVLCSFRLVFFWFMGFFSFYGFYRLLLIFTDFYLYYKLYLRFFSG